MTDTNAYRQAIRDTVELVKHAAGKKAGSIHVSPEVAALLDAVSLAPKPPPSQPTHEQTTLLEAIAQEIAQCAQCSLSETRQNTVPGHGNPSADLVFVGEAPGAEEDRTGLPFVGRAGDLLTDIIVKGMKMRREDVFICNVLKCRPPGNRDPNPLEVSMCEPFLIRQLEALQPKVIVALGRHAAQTLLRTTESTGRLRGRWHNYHGIPFRVTYHPAYLLRSPGEKKKTWEDIQEVMKVLSDEVTPNI